MSFIFLFLCSMVPFICCLIPFPSPDDLLFIHAFFCLPLIQFRFNLHLSFSFVPVDIIVYYLSYFPWRSFSTDFWRIPFCSVFVNSHLGWLIFMCGCLLIRFYGVYYLSTGPYYQFALFVDNALCYHQVFYPSLMLGVYLRFNVYTFISRLRVLSYRLL